MYHTNLVVECSSTTTLQSHHLNFFVLTITSPIDIPLCWFTARLCGVQHFCAYEIEEINTLTKLIALFHYTGKAVIKNGK